MVQPTCAEIVPNSGGAAILFQNLIFERTISKTFAHEAAGPVACSFRAENVGLRAGLKLCLADPAMKKCRLLICTDSLSQLDALARGPILQTDDTANELWHLLLQLAAREVDITMQFIYSHCGLERNELVDKEAKTASELPQADAPVWLPYLMSAVRRHGKSKDIESEEPLKHLTHLSCNQSTFLSQIRCNECPDLGRLAHRIGTSMVESCRWCCPEEHKAAAPAVPRISAARSVDPCKCPYCDEVISTRPNCLKHCLRWHTEIPEEEARRKLNCVKASDPKKKEKKKEEKKKEKKEEKKKEGKKKEETKKESKSKTTTPSLESKSKSKSSTADKPILHCPDPHCPNKFTTTSAGGLTRHVNSAHPTLRKEQPDAKPTNLRATRGIGVVETPLHVLQECPRLLSLRQQHFPKPFSKDNPIPWFSASLFKFFHAALQQLKPDGKGRQI